MPQLAAVRNQERAWTAWIIGVAFVILVFAFQTGYAVTKDDVAAHAGLSARQIGLVGSVYTWSFALTQLVSGSLLDRAGARRVLPFAVLMLALGIFSFSQASSFGMLLFSQVLVALGACFGFVGAGFIGGAWFGMARYGLMFAFVQFIASISAYFNQRIFDKALATFSWQQVLVTMAASALALTAVMLLGLKDPPGWDETHGWPRRPKQFIENVMHDVATVLRVPRLWTVLILGATSFAAMLAIGIVWGPDTAMANGLSRNQANVVGPLSWLGLAFGAPAFAYLSDRLQRRKPLLILSVVAQALLLALMVWGNLDTSLSMGAVFLLFGFMAGGSMLPFTMAAELAGTRFAGTSASLVNGSQFVAGGVLMFLPGWLQDSFDMGVGKSILSLAVVLAISLLLAGILPESFGRQDQHQTTL